MQTTVFKAGKTGKFDIADISVSNLSGKAVFTPEADGDVLRIYCEGSGVTADSVSVRLRYSYPSGCRIFVNGFQSWTDSKEYFPNEKMFSPSAFMRPILYGSIGRIAGLSGSGDYGICRFPLRRGSFYGFSYGYVRTGGKADVFASVSERTGYTIVRFDANAGEVIFTSDIKGKKIADGRTCVLNVGIFSGEYDEAFDKWFAAQGVVCREVPLTTGYTTWYNYYRNVTEDIVLRDLDAMAGLECRSDIFQIDDGYQKAIGDWLHTDEKKFAKGMKYLADAIHGKNMTAGLWLAPFAVTKDCFIWKEHKDWLISINGKPFKAGANWGGFYALDIYNEQVRAYIRKVFDTVLDEWGYDLVKLDFLYAAAMIPMCGKSRGEIMCDAMDFLRECCKDKLILGCGVPLMPAFGKVDYCRIGPDLSLGWGKNRMDSREDVSTAHAICNTVFRRHLDGRAFGNDPDVFLLRDNNINMSRKQRYAVAKVNQLLGRVLFTSDNVGEYDNEQMKVLLDVFGTSKAHVTRAEFEKDGILVIEYDERGTRRRLRINPYRDYVSFE